MKFKFKNIKKEHRILFWILIAVILLMVFVPREHSIFSMGVSAHLGNLKGKINVETFDPSRFPDSNEVLTVAKDKKSFVMYYTPWCGWSKKAKPAFMKLHQKNPTDTLIAAVNCDDRKDIAEQHSVSGYPTFKFHPTGLNNPGTIYSGDRDYDSMVQFLKTK